VKRNEVGRTVKERAKANNGGSAKIRNGRQERRNRAVAVRKNILRQGARVVHDSRRPGP
jgi:hypothetical protein